MDQRPVVWNAANTKHIEGDHPERSISSAEVTEALSDPDRVEAIATRSGVDYHEVLGLSRAGRPLFVVWVDHPDGRFPVHGRRAGRKAAGRYYR